MLHKDLLEAQREFDLKSTSAGFQRYHKSQTRVELKEGLGSTDAGRKAIKGCLPLVSAEVSRWLLANDRKGVGKTHTALSTLAKFDPDVLAFVALNSVFSGITRDTTVSAVQVHIGTTLENEVIALELVEQRNAKIAKRLLEKAGQQGSQRGKTKALKKLVSAQEGFKHEDWMQDFKIRIGEPLVNAVLLALPDIFELKEENKGVNKTRVLVRLTEAGMEMLFSLTEAVEWSAPIHRPMVVLPRPWTSFDTGCYHDEGLARGVKLVRTYNKDHQALIRKAIRSGQMNPVLEALNAAQEVSWSINQPVLEIMDWAYHNDIEIPGLPMRVAIPKPDKLPEAQWEAMTVTERKGHRLKLAGIHEKNLSIVADKSVMDRDLETAKDLTRFERFYLPHNLDFRGRVYPVCHFSHQRADHIKALFAFADGEALGEFGAGWLSVHLANCGDFGKVSKRSFDDRLAWVEANEALILRVAGDPAGTVSEWSEADSPFMFLAACLDYAGWIASGRSEHYVSHLPIALDGSNSGLQHYSAALRAEDEAAYVSLVPSEVPADLYQKVADMVQAQARLDAVDYSWKEMPEGTAKEKEAKAKAEAKQRVAALCVLAGIDRSLVKRNVMTFAYSSEQYGFRQQLLSDTMAPLNEKILLGKADRNKFSMLREDGSDDGGFAASGYLAAAVYHGVTNTVRKATEGMAFFKQVAATLAHESLPLAWVTPVGLPVLHRYDEFDVKRVELFLYDRAIPVADATPKDRIDEEVGGVLKRVRANIRTQPNGKIDKDKARSAVAPNVIHSMDAAHLMLTVLEAKDLGIKDIALIHDSFGTHAGRTQEFFYVIREAFVAMYQNYDPFEEILDAAKAVLSPEGNELLPPLPAKGTLDLSVICDAPYAFA